MLEPNDGARDIFMDTVITKIDQQDERSQLQEKRITALETRQIADDKSARDLDAIEVKVQQLNKRLDIVIPLLNRPPQSEVRHHHHVPKLVWATAGLFLALCLVSTGWLMTNEKIEQYRAGDFKYRHLKLTVDSSGLVYLYRVDSIYQSNPDSFRNSVIDQERLKKERLDLLDRIKSINAKIGQAHGTTDENKNGQK